jgi:hypothetical protein
VFALPFLNKPAGAWCIHARETGCAIHDSDERHARCKTYACLWLSEALGPMPDKFRPDRCRLTLTPRFRYKQAIVLFASQAYDGAHLNNHYGAELVAELVRNRHILVIGHAGNVCIAVNRTTFADWNERDTEAVMKVLAAQDQATEMPPVANDTT